MTADCYTNSIIIIHELLKAPFGALHEGAGAKTEIRVVMITKVVWMVKAIKINNNTVVWICVVIHELFHKKHLSLSDNRFSGIWH